MLQIVRLIEFMLKRLAIHSLNRNLEGRSCPRLRHDVAGRTRRSEASSSSCRTESRARDGYTQAGEPLWSVLWKNGQNQPRHNAVPRQADGHGCQGAGGLPEPQGTVSLFVFFFSVSYA